jgi:thiopeptide-type bacteriocin biosynthesis protein
VERYGGPKAIEAAEKFFSADSLAVLKILQQVDNEKDQEDLRWKIGLLGIDRLLDDFGLGLAEKKRIVGEWREGLLPEFGTNALSKHHLGERLRKERATFECLLQEHIDETWGFYKNVFWNRSQAIATAITEIEDLKRKKCLLVPMIDLAHSHAHLHLNRLLPSAQRAQELVAYEFLCRIYESSLAKAKYSPKGGSALS